MNWLKTLALSSMAVGMMACSGEHKEDMQPEDLPVDQQQMEAAPDTTMADTTAAEVPATAPAKPSAPAKNMPNTQNVDPVGDGSIQKVTTKKGSDGSAMPTTQEDAAKPLSDDGSIEKVTTKKKR